MEHTIRFEWKTMTYSKHVVFTPVVPHDTKNGNVVYTEMNNSNYLCYQLIQSYIPLYAVEKVYRIAKLIQLRRPEVHHSVF